MIQIYGNSSSAQALKEGASGGAGPVCSGRGTWLPARTVAIPDALPSRTRSKYPDRNHFAQTMRSSGRPGRDPLASPVRQRARGRYLFHTRTSWTLSGVRLGSGGRNLRAQQECRPTSEAENSHAPAPCQGQRDQMFNKPKGTLHRLAASRHSLDQSRSLEQLIV